MPMGCQTPERLWLTGPLNQQGKGCSTSLADNDHCSKSFSSSNWIIWLANMNLFKCYIPRTAGLAWFWVGSQCITSSCAVCTSRWFSCHSFSKLVVNLSPSLIGEAHRPASPLDGWQPAIGGAGKTRPKSCNCQKNWPPRHLGAGISRKGVRGRAIHQDFQELQRIFPNMFVLSSLCLQI